MNPIDLHTHTTASDGTDTPEELIDLAIEKGLSAIAITDHDTLDGLHLALEYAKDKPIKVVSGIEFSTNDKRHSGDLHILGFDFDPYCNVFADGLDDLRASRHERNLKMLNKLNELGFDMTYEEIEATASGGVVTRAHFGKTMAKKGLISREQVAYDKYIGNGCPAYVPKDRLTPKMAIDMIKKAGGIAVLAHPTLYGLNERGIEDLIAWLVKDGLMGIEAVYSLHDTRQEAHLKGLAKKHDLVISGGSDYHGHNKTYIHLGVGRGNLFVPEKILDDMLAVKR